MGVDLRVPKIRFATLIEDIPSTAVSQFIVWLDEKVAEFKVNGAMALDSSAEAPRWIRDYSMSVMLSGMSSSQSDNNSEHLPHERTSSSRRKEFPPRPRPQFMRRSPIPSPPVVSKPNRTVSGADISISRAAGEVTPHRQKRARDDGDSALSVVRANSNDLELVEIKKERLDDLVERTPLQVTNIIERGDNVPIQSSRVRSTELVPINSLSQDDSLYGSTTPIRSMKEEPLPDSESGDVVDELPSDSFNTRDSSLRQSRPVSDMLPILSSPHSSTPVISRITPGIDRTSLLASQQSALEMSVESGQADDSFNIMSQEAISLDDSDDNDDSIIKGDAPEDFMTRIMAFESQHTDAGESGDGSMEGVPGTSGVGQSDMLLGDDALVTALSMSGLSKSSNQGGLRIDKIARGLSMMRNSPNSSEASPVGVLNLCTGGGAMSTINMSVESSDTSLSTTSMTAATFPNYTIGNVVLDDANMLLRTVMPDSGDVSSMSLEGDDAHQDSSADISFPCLFEACNEVFFDLPAIKAHLYIHARQYRMDNLQMGLGFYYLCPKCSKVVSDRSFTFVRHCLGHYEQMRSVLNCRKCGKTFKRNDLYLAHMRAHRRNSATSQSSNFKWHTFLPPVD